MLKYNILFIIVLLVKLVTSTPVNHQAFNGKISGMERMKDPKLKNCLDKCPVYLDLNPQCASDGRTYPSTSSFHCMKKCLKPHGEVLLVHLVTSNPADYRLYNGYLSGMDRWNDPKLKNCVGWCPVLLSLTPECASDGKTYPNLSYIRCLQKCVEPLGEDLTPVSPGFCKNDIIHSD